MTVAESFVKSAMPNLTTLLKRGFVPNSNKDNWTTPEMATFEDPDEVWEKYKNRGSPEERARLRAMLDAGGRRRGRSEVKLRRAS